MNLGSSPSKLRAFLISCSLLAMLFQYNNVILFFCYFYDLFCAKAKNVVTLFAFMQNNGD